MENKESERPHERHAEISSRRKRSRDDGKRDYPVERILRHRFNDDDGSPEFQVLWKGYPESEATWQSLLDVIRNKQFGEYYRALPRKTRKNIRLPFDLPIGDDEDGLCFRRAVKKLKLDDVDVQQFGPWTTLGNGIQKLRDAGCSVRKLRPGNATKGRKLLMIEDQHMVGADCKSRGYQGVRRKFMEVYVVTKLDSR